MEIYLPPLYSTQPQTHTNHKLATIDCQAIMVFTKNQIPTAYRLLFLYIEPVLAVLGSFYAVVKPEEYLSLLDTASAADAAHSALPIATTIALSQLANVYVLCGLNEALILRATAELQVWRLLLGAFLLADVGHLASALPRGFTVFWNITDWNRMDWGGIGFVYVLAAARISFLAGVGFDGVAQGRVKSRNCS
jgi:hypothetical protein